MADEAEPTFIDPPVTCADPPSLMTEVDELLILRLSLLVLLKFMPPSLISWHNPGKLKLNKLIAPNMELDMQALTMQPFIHPHPILPAVFLSELSPSNAFA
jgi:hypothetical protein